MVDIEKVIKGLTVHCDYFAECDECPYRNEESPGVGCVDELCNDAIALLKEREPIKPISRFNKLLNETIYWCGKCEANIEKNQSFCGCCGRAVRWNETLKSEPDTLEPLVRLFDD